MCNSYVLQVLGFFLPDPTNGGVQDVASWIILLFLYSTVFCLVWMMLLGAFNRWVPCLRQDDLQEYLGNTFLKLLWIIRSVLISSKELLFDFGSLFIFTAIVRASLNQVTMFSCLVCVYQGGVLLGRGT